MLFGGITIEGRLGRNTVYSAWNDRVKNIEVGPGSLDISAMLRVRYEDRQRCDLKTYYGADNGDDMLFEHIWLDMNYRPARRCRLVLFTEHNGFLNAHETSLSNRKNFEAQDKLGMHIGSVLSGPMKKGVGSDDTAVEYG
jgi:hypothetical protein